MKKGTFLARNIQYLRKKRKFTQDSLAESLGWKRNNISSYEKGLAEPSLQRLVALSNFFHLSIDLLLNFNLEETGEDISGKGGKAYFQKWLLLHEKLEEESEIVENLLKYHQLKYRNLLSDNRQVIALISQHEELLQTIKLMFDELLAIMNYEEENNLS